MKKQKKKAAPKKAWSGRFTEPTHPLVEEFNASIGFDRRLWRQDIRGSVAHARMLGARGIIPAEDAAAIVRGLGLVEREIEAGLFRFDVADEDIHMAVERRLTALIGPVAGKLHTARSRNDQVATDFRLFVMDAVDEVDRLLRGLMKVLAVKAGEHLETVAPSYTHLQPAQPIRLAHWFLAYYEMCARDRERFAGVRLRADVMPLGSAALAGTNFPVDRKMVAKELGFSRISANSLDAVSDRDFAAEYLFAAALTGAHLSRLAEELIVAVSAEFATMELPDAFCTGSSIMPQKKNPDVPELLRGKTGRLNGNLVGLLTVLKGLPLAYNKDLQEDKEGLFDSHDTLVTSLRLAADMLSALKVDRERLAARAEEGYMAAVDVADRLVIAGVPFREAHEIVGKLVRHCIDRGAKFTELSKTDLKGVDPRLASVGVDGLTPAASADGKDVPGGTARKRIAARLGQIEREMARWS